MASKNVTRLTLTKRNCDTIRATLSPRREGKIKDLMMYKKARSIFGNHLKNEPMKPNRPWKDDEKPTEEQITKFNEENAKYFQEMSDYWKEEVEVELNPIYVGLVKSCIERFEGFFTDEKSCDANIELAEKFGITLDV